MKISKISLIFLSGLLVTQAMMPMETPANNALKKAQKAGKIALKIGAGTATFGIYTLLGTAALASWGITAGAAALSLMRFLSPKPSKTLKVAPEVPQVSAPTSKKVAVKKPHIAPKIKSEKTPKNNRTMRYSQGLQAAGVAGLAVVENDLLDTRMLRETRMTNQQVHDARYQQSLDLQAELQKCDEQKIQWSKDYKSVYHAELPRFEGPYQDMIGIYDADIEDMRNESQNRMKDQIERRWNNAGCADSEAQMQSLARRMAQNQMRLLKNI